VVAYLHHYRIRRHRYLRQRPYLCSLFLSPSHHIHSS
jgi:hypothetical protein